jgi:ferritin
MKISVAAVLAALLPSAAALQGNYLSQLAPPSTSSQQPTKQGGAFFPTPTQNSMPPQQLNMPSGGNTGNAAAAPSQELLELWSKQVSVELSASQLYLSASIWFRNRGYPGMAAWMLDESGEERGHGLAILEWAMKKQFPVVLEPLEAPKNDWQNEVQVWESILQAEQTNTQNLLRLADAANKCGEYGCVAFLDEFHGKIIM